eukprot:scaffold10532_cov449-Chaetoceros_neogracile.AAC.4
MPSLLSGCFIMYVERIALRKVKTHSTLSELVVDVAILEQSSTFHLSQHFPIHSSSSRLNAGLARSKGMKP